MELDARAIELVLERGVAELCQRAADIIGRIGEHRLHRLERRQGKRREAGFAVGERGARHRRKVARQHRGPTDPRGRNSRRARHGIGKDAFQRALPQLAEQQTEQKVLLGGGCCAHQLANASEQGVDVA